MYSEFEIEQLRRAIYENVTEQMLWQVLYINSVAQKSPNIKTVRDKLMSLPKNFALIMTNSIKGSPELDELIGMIYGCNATFAEYIDETFSGSDCTVIVSEITKETQDIAKNLNAVNPFWQTETWMVMIDHQRNLMNNVINDAIDQKYETWDDLLPTVRRLKLDMADYLITGIVNLSDT